MRVIHVAGTSGAGKSAISRRLRALGHHAVSTDGTEGLCHWVDDTGTSAERPDSPDRGWLDTHHWVWDAPRLDALLDEHRPIVGAGLLYLCGTADNDDEFVDRFDRTVLLDIDELTMLVRVQDPGRGNDFGRCGDSLDALLARLPSTRDRYRRRGAITVDATADLDTVVAALLRAVPGQTMMA